MLPFSSFEFFIFIFAFICVLRLSKQFLTGPQYRYVLFFLNAFFLLLVYPKPWHFVLLILYSYTATRLASEVFRFSKKIYGILLLLLPLLLVKADIRFDFYPFELNNMLSFAGLSYASFRILSYYMDKAPQEGMAPFVSYFNFLAFTPTMLIGPIDRYGHYKKSEEQGYEALSADNTAEGWKALVKGIAFKYVIAEVIDRYWLEPNAVHNKEFGHMLLEMYGYYAYLFFDFAGYSFMALGLGRMMGIAVPVNFTNPFVAVNPQDFWKRFHITLGDWLRTYFFTPLYMFFTRKKSLKAYPLFRQNLALLLTFLLMGCWNGFKTNFMLSGLIFGIYSAIHNSYVMACKKADRDVVFGAMNQRMVKYISIFMMLNLAAFALYIFSGRCPFL
jgi:membrane protein involved in D-alanine export